MIIQRVPNSYFLVNTASYLTAWHTAHTFVRCVGWWCYLRLITAREHRHGWLLALGKMPAVFPGDKYLSDSHRSYLTHSEFHSSLIFSTINSWSANAETTGAGRSSRYSNPVAACSTASRTCSSPPTHTPNPHCSLMHTTQHPQLFNLHHTEEMANASAQHLVCTQHPSPGLKATTTLLLLLLLSSLLVSVSGFDPTLTQPSRTPWVWLPPLWAPYPPHGRPAD